MEAQTAGKTSKEKGTGNITSMKLDLTKPMPMNFDMQIKNLMIMVGANGTGKTFILVMNYIMASLAQLAVATGMYNSISIAQTVFDGCIDDRNINGTVAATFESGAVVEASLTDGVVDTFTCTGFEGLTLPRRIIYLSSQFRLFTHIKGYLVARRMINSQNVSQEILHEELSKNFKMYDIAYIEMLIYKIGSIDISRFTQFMSGFDGAPTDFVSFGIDLDKDFYSIDSKGVKKYLSTYSAGEQALINMALANC